MGKMGTLLGVPFFKGLGVEGHDDGAEGHQDRAQGRADHDALLEQQARGQRNGQDVIPGGPPQVLDHLGIGAARNIN